MQINRSILVRGSYASIGDYVALTKPRVMSLVVFTALVGLMVAPGGIDPFAGVVALLCIAAGAGAAGALNMWYDADIDALMARTAMRPIPSGRVSRSEALVFGLMLGTCAVLSLFTFLNIAAAALLAFTIFFYVVVYTMWLKRRTPQNIVIGGAAGALPPVIGWVAAAGDVGLEPLILFLIIFLWTPPHFWALSLNLAGEYARAGVPMLPVVAGRAETKRQILLYSVLLAPVSLLPWALGFAGAIYGVAAAMLGAIMIFLSWQVRRSNDKEKAAGAPPVRVFHALSGPSFWCAVDGCRCPTFSLSDLERSPALRFPGRLQGNPVRGGGHVEIVRPHDQLAVRSNPDRRSVIGRSSFAGNVVAATPLSALRRPLKGRY